MHPTVGRLVGRTDVRLDTFDPVKWENFPIFSANAVLLFDTKIVCYVYDVQNDLFPYFVGIFFFIVCMILSCDLCTPFRQSHSTALTYINTQSHAVLYAVPTHTLCV